MNEGEPAPVGPPRADLFANAFLGMQQIAAQPTDIYIGMVLIGSGAAPDLADVRRTVEPHLPDLPALTHRAVAGRRGIEWQPDPDFDLDRHLEVRSDLLPEAATAQRLLDPAPDPEHPLWRIVLITGDGRRWALAYFVHHAAQDGTAMLRTLERLFGGDGGAGVRPVALVSPASAPAKFRRRQALRALPNIAGTWRSAPRLEALSTPAQTDRVLNTVSVPAIMLNEIGRATGTTAAQTHLAVLAGVLRSWSPGDFAGPRARDQAVVVPIDTRVGDEFPTAGSLLGLLRIRIPTSCADPVRRAAIMRRRLSRRRVTAYRSALRALAEEVPVRWSGEALRRLGDRRSVAMTVSVFRRLDPLAVCGAEVEQAVAVPWLPPGHGFFAILARYRDQAVLSVLTDRDDAHEPRLVDWWAADLARLHGAVTSS